MTAQRFGVLAWRRAAPSRPRYPSWWVVIGHTLRRRAGDCAIAAATVAFVLVMVIVGRLLLHL